MLDVHYAALPSFDVWDVPDGSRHKVQPIPLLTDPGPMVARTEATYARGEVEVCVTRTMARRRTAHRPSRREDQRLLAEVIPMIKTVKSQSEHLTALRVSQQSGDIGPLVVSHEEDLSPAVTQAELDSSIDALTPCGSRRLGGRRPKRRGRCERLPVPWCRLGKRAAGSPRPETKFG